MNGSALIDRSLKALARRAAPAFFRLAGITVDPSAIHWEDVSVNLPELRADQVLLVEADGDAERWAMHVEFQLEPDRRVLPDWFFKNAALTRQLGMEVLLTVIYLRRGRRARFPTAYIVRRGGARNRFEFATVRLWEHAERIRSGDLQELAPLLVLCENEPTEATLREERDLIRRLAVPPETRSDLLAIAVMVGTRYFGRELLLELFREEMEMLKEASIIQDGLDDSEARGRAVGEAEGEARGQTREARRILLRQLRRRFGDLPEEVVDRIQNADRDWCEAMVDRLFEAGSLDELGLASHPSGEV
jgi:predicted transposase YdaD